MRSRNNRCETYIITAFSVGNQVSPANYGQKHYDEDVHQFQELAAYLLRT
jgi:hypothetical protein